MLWSIYLYLCTFSPACPHVIGCLGEVAGAPEHWNEHLTVQVALAWLGAPQGRLELNPPHDPSISPPTLNTLSLYLRSLVLKAAIALSVQL